jgi:cold shock CspA family protein
MGSTIEQAIKFRGVVKWFRASTETKCDFGFITKSDGEDVFVHGKNIRKDDYPLDEGDEVEFTVKLGRDLRPTAGDVHKVRTVLPANFKLPGA